MKLLAASLLSLSIALALSPATAADAPTFDPQRLSDAVKTLSSDEFEGRGTTGAFYTVTPCRIVDTRNPDGPFGGPAFQPLNIRVFAIPGSCGIPAEATAIAANLTATNTTGVGHFLAYATGISQPTTSNLNFRVGRTRANNATIALGVAGQITVLCALPFGSTADFILDIAGYFQ